MISGISTKLFVMPLICFFDDFGAIAPGELSETSLLTFSLSSPKIGVELKIEKSEFGRRLTFLGLEGGFPCDANNFRLSANLTPEKLKIGPTKSEHF